MVPLSISPWFLVVLSPDGARWRSVLFLPFDFCLLPFDLLFSSFAPQSVYLSQCIEHLGHLAQCFQAVACLTLPVGTFIPGAGNVLRLGLPPQVLEVDQDHLSATGAQQLEKSAGYGLR